MTASNWIEVDRAGLAQVIADRPKSFLLMELIQNALDEPGVTDVDVEVSHLPGTQTHLITVTDDAPDGYADIRHAWTMFAPSKKKGDPELRGRFNIGCKLVLALAKSAKVVSTKSAVVFDAKQGRRVSRERRDKGTQFNGLFVMSKAEVAEAIEQARRVIPPPGIRLRINDQLVQRPGSIFHVEDVLPTVYADEEGVLRNTRRKAKVEVYEPRHGERPTLFELGIPVVELDGDDPYHLNVLQRVPLNSDRDNVTPAYLRQLRVVVLNGTHHLLTEEEARSTWATEASEDDRASDAAVDSVMTARFGTRRVAYDPSDPEANKLAVSKGYTVVPGGSLTRGQWANVRRGGAVLPAGKVTPSQKLESAPDGVPAIPESEWTPTMLQMATVAKNLWHGIELTKLRVTWYKHPGLPFTGAWSNRELCLNASKIGHMMRAFERGDRRLFVALLIHEFAHERVSDHLSEEFYRELCRIGAELWHLGASK